MLDARNLAKVFGDRTVVGDVSLHVRRGDIVGLVGPGGAGKTTVFGMLAGIVTPDRGTVHLDGANVTSAALF
ncbi:MAG TPA: LPS export ABC transporter ATP-binding protein, partial [Afipia sp.]|nr:LPS export ABC transporter ATP-binding protein [Afipia sp.]